MQKAKVEIISKGILPGNLRKKFRADETRLDGNILLPFVDDSLVPLEMPFVQVPDFSRFYKSANGIDIEWSISIPQACYFNSICGGEKGIKLLERIHGLKLQKAITAPIHGIDYNVLVHENMHDVFWSMPSNKQGKLVEAAEQIGDITHMMRYARLERVNFRRDFIDEFIAAWFTREGDLDRFDGRIMPDILKNTMRDVGYNVDTPPAVYLNELERVFANVSELSWWSILDEE